MFTNIFQTVLQPGHSFSLLLSLTVKPLWMRPSCVPGSSKPKQEHPKENGASQNCNGSKFNGFQQNRWMKPWFQAPKRFDEMTTPPLKKKGGTSSHYFPLVNPEIWKVNLRMARMAGREIPRTPKMKARGDPTATHTNPIKKYWNGIGGRYGVPLSLEKSTFQAMLFHSKQLFTPNDCTIGSVSDTCHWRGGVGSVHRKPQVEDELSWLVTVSLGGHQ